MARRRGTTRGRMMVAMWGITPRSISGSRKLAVSEATMRLQPRASSNPLPHAFPCTAATETMSIIRSVSKILL